MKSFDHRSGRLVAVDDAELYCEVVGHDDDPPLLLLHGGFGHLEDFNDLLAAIDRPFRAIGIDSRGQGRSTLGSAPLSYALLQSDVERVLDALDVRDALVVGASDGGVVAYRLALAPATRVARLVTIGARWHVKNADATRRKFEDSTGATWRREQPTAYDDYQRLNPAPDFERLTRALVAMWLDGGPSGHPGNAAFAIPQPLLLARGDDDPNLALDAIAELHARLPRSALLNIPFAGHPAHREQLAVFVAAFDAFMRR